MRIPGFIKPQLATLKSKAPKGNYLHEIKFDGYRVQLHIDGDARKAFTRNGHDWVKRFSRIAGALDIPGQAIIDGEVRYTPSTLSGFDIAQNRQLIERAHAVVR